LLRKRMVRFLKAIGPVRQGPVGLAVTSVAMTASGSRTWPGLRGRNKQTIDAILDRLTSRLVFPDLASALLILGE
jgi:hypothetical protein